MVIHKCTDFRLDWILWCFSWDRLHLIRYALNLCFITKYNRIFLWWICSFVRQMMASPLFYEWGGSFGVEYLGSKLWTDSKQCDIYIYKHKIGTNWIKILINPTNEKHFSPLIPWKTPMLKLLEHSSHEASRFLTSAYVCLVQRTRRDVFIHIKSFMKTTKIGTYASF